MIRVISFLLAVACGTMFAFWFNGSVFYPEISIGDKQLTELSSGEVASRLQEGIPVATRTLILAPVGEPIWVEGNWPSKVSEFGFPLLFSMFVYFGVKRNESNGNASSSIKEAFQSIIPAVYLVGFAFCILSIALVSVERFRSFREYLWKKGNYKLANEVSFFDQLGQYVTAQTVLGGFFVLAMLAIVPASIFFAHPGRRSATAATALWVITFAFASLGILASTALP